MLLITLNSFFAIKMNQSLGNCSYFNEQQPMFNAIRCAGSNCFSMWQLNEEKFELINKGCWKNVEKCESNLVRNVLFCCCTGEFCNRNTDPEYCFDQTREQLNWSRILRIFRNSFASLVPNIKSNYLMALGALVGLLCLVLIGLYLRSFYKAKKTVIRRLVCSLFNASSRTGVVYDEKHLLKKDSDLIEKESIKFENGSHADIYKGILIRRDKTVSRVAIKVFRSENAFFFKNELQLYSLPRMKHENIVQFVKAKKIDDEFWLITRYQEQSSLLNFLRRNTLNLNQLVQICLDISRALAHLHGQNNHKMTIAHLDIKPANILLSGALRACLCDFELSRAFRNSKPLFAENSPQSSEEMAGPFNQTSLIKQAGTTRYLAPEVLGGLISSWETPAKCVDLYINSLLQTDIYSCSLVYWEILNCLEVNERPDCQSMRGQASDGKRPQKKYRMAFENCKNDDELTKCVVARRERPRVEKRWRSNCLLNLFCQTVEECWEHDPKKRLTSIRLHERLKSIHNSINRLS